MSHSHVPTPAPLTIISIRSACVSTVCSWTVRSCSNSAIRACMGATAGRFVSAPPVSGRAAVEALSSGVWSAWGGEGDLCAERQGFEELGGALGNGILAEQDDGEQFSVRQRRPESQNRTDSVPPHELLLGRDVGAPFRLEDVKHVERMFLRVEEQVLSGRREMRKRPT